MKRNLRLFNLLVILLLLWPPVTKRALSAEPADVQVHAALLQQCDDAYEPNESFAQAWYLAPGIIQSYLCTPSDMDYYKFTADAGEQISLDLYKLPANYDVCLYDPSEQWITCSSSGGTTAETIEHVATASGDHYVLVYGAQGAYDEVEPYTLSIAVTTPCTAATNVQITGPTTGAVSAAHTFTATVSPFTVTLPVTYTWQATDQSAVQQVWNGTQTTAAFTWKTSGPKTITVSANNCGTPVSATHPITIAETATCGDLYEPNETFADAHLLDPLDPAGYHAYICTSTDQDYFGFEVALHDAITLTLDQLPQNYDLELWDSSETLVAESHHGGVTPEQILFVASNAEGQYRARVMGVGGTYHETQPYHLTIQVGTTIPPTLTVNTTDDGDDGACDASHCSLREAINAVNTSDAFRVQFSIPTLDAGYDGDVWTIQPGSPLPTVTQRLNLYGTTQTGNRGDTNPLGPEIVLDGIMAGTGANGLAFTSSGLVEGLGIVNWAEAGVRVEGATQVYVQGCYIGVDFTGRTPASNHDGIVLVGGHSHHVGGAGEGNLISGNERHGLHLSGTAYAQVQGNQIGTDRIGQSALGNGWHGIYLSDGAQWNTLGGDLETEGNLISGNGYDGVRIDDPDSDYNRVWGNRIGVNATMFGPLGNDGDGVEIRYGDWNTIGGIEDGQGNVIAGNGSGPDTPYTGRGICLSHADHTTVAGNLIGTTPSGSTHSGNDQYGIRIDAGSQFNTVGPDNVIAHNGLDGVLVYGLYTTRNSITRNSITGNGDLGIDNASGGNLELAPPIIVSATTSHVQGAACPRCRVEIFGDYEREGRDYDDVVTATVSGAWIWYGSPSQGPDYATATATDSDGNTSEFSTCRDPYEPNEDLAHAIEIDAGTDVRGYICHHGDQDYFRLPVAAYSDITLQLFTTPRYRMSLYGPDGTLLSETLASTIAYKATEGGDYFIRMDGDATGDDPVLPYTYVLRITVAPFDTRITTWVDEGSSGGPAVYKLIPDAAGLAGQTWVDIEAAVSVGSGEHMDVFVTLTIPGDFFGAPESVGCRYCIGCPLTPIETWVDEGDGRYRVPLHLTPLTALPTYSHGRIVFRFAIPPGASPGEVLPSAEVRFSAAGDVVATDDASPIRLVEWVPAIVITSRHHLYNTHYAPGLASILLGDITHAAQGPVGGPAGSMLAAIYYVDDYSADVRDWDNTALDYSSGSVSNGTAWAVDDLIGDWVDDAAPGASHLLIVGDDDVIPFFRLRDPTGREAESPDEGYPPLDDALAHDYIFTDNAYASLVGRVPGVDGYAWEVGNLHLDIGRIVGDSISDMQRLFEGGLSGPIYDPVSPRAVLASWDGPDLHYDCRTCASSSVLVHVRDWGFSASGDLVDNGDWDRDDLLDALRTQFSLFIHADHGNPYDLGAPPPSTQSAVTDAEIALLLGKKDAIPGADIALAVSTTFPSQFPFYAFEDCRVGFTLVNDGVIDRLARLGASGFVAASGITNHSPEGSETYSEKLFNMFVRRAIPRSGSGRTVGYALRLAKMDYSPAGWRVWARKAVSQFILFGVPWMAIPPIPGSVSAQNVSARNASARDAGVLGAAPPAALFPAPRAVSDGTYVASITVDAANYTITQPVPGFDWIEVEGFEQGWFDGPMLPTRDLTFPLPPGAEIGDVSVQFGDQVSLGVLDVPSYTFGVALLPDGVDPVWGEIPAEMGLIPTEPYTYELKNLDTHRAAHVHVIPVTYDAASDQATLYRQITVTVSYTTPVDVAITDFVLDARRWSPGTAVSASAEVVNVSDTPAVITSVMSLVDVYGNEVSSTSGGPFTVPAGGSQTITPPAPSAATEGTYLARLVLWQEGAAVAQASAVAPVVAVQAIAFEGPDIITSGETAVFSVTLANYTTDPLESGFALELNTDWGLPVAALTSTVQTVPAGGQVTAGFVWDSTGAPLGRYRATAVATPAGYDPRGLSKSFEVQERQFVYLPLVMRGHQQVAAVRRPRLMCMSKLCKMEIAKR